MGFTFSGDPRQFTLLAQELEGLYAKAATATMNDASGILKSRARANIAAAGLSQRWQNAYQTKVFPSQPSINAAVFGSENIGYAGIFEDDGSTSTIAGQPLLWLALPTVPLGVGGHPLRPREAAQRFGDLVSLNRPGHRPLLVAKVGGRFARMVPLYVGLDSVTLRKRLSIGRIAEEVASSLPDLFDKNLKGG